jgi:16S rRNA (cytosine967-C5)-methyltransferase
VSRPQRNFKAKRRPTVQGLPPRAVALGALVRILHRGVALDAAFAESLAEQRDLEPRDRGLAFAIVNHTLRRAGQLQAWLDGNLKRPLGPKEPANVIVLLSLAQLVALETPPHAVGSTALALAQAEGGRTTGLKSLIQALIGKAAREGVALGSAELNIPVAVRTRWLAHHGAQNVAAWAEALLHEPPLDVQLKDPAQTAHWAQLLGGESLAPGHVRLVQPGRIDELPGFADGAWWVQDVAASWPARLLPFASGDRVIDLCAAPGGKTMQLAARGGQVTALDISDERLARVAENLDRTGLHAKLVAADALTWRPETPVKAILLDAPCSATGTFRRHPDVLRHRAALDLGPVQALQAKLLRHAVSLLAPGGVLVYAVCALEPEEGPAQIAALLRDHPNLKPLPVTPAEAGPFGEALTPEGWLSIQPHHLAAQGGADGFFIARIERPC